MQNARHCRASGVEKAADQALAVLVASRATCACEGSLVARPLTAASIASVTTAALNRERSVEVVRVFMVAVLAALRLSMDAL
jgi:hypothetical protein